MCHSICTALVLFCKLEEGIGVEPINSFAENILVRMMSAPRKHALHKLDIKAHITTYVFIFSLYNWAWYLTLDTTPTLFLEEITICDSYRAIAI